MTTLIAILLAFSPCLLSATPNMWTTFTSTSNAVDLLIADDRLWTATSGGLASFDPETGAFEIFTNIRGLAMNKCIAVGRDPRGFVWAAHDDGRITRIHPELGATQQIVDLQQGEVFEINDILSVGDEVLVATNNGIYRFSFYPIVNSYRNRQWIRKLGSFSSEMAVVDLAATRSYIYAATREGLARTWLNSDSLNAYVPWETFTPSNSGLPEADVKAVYGTSASDDVLLATSSWVARMAEGQIVPETRVSGVESFGGSTGAYDWAASRTRLYARDVNTRVWTAIPDTLPAISGLVVMNDSVLALSLADDAALRGGIQFREARIESLPWEEPHRAAGIGGNTISRVMVDSRGRLWCAGTAQGSLGVYVYDGTEWRNYQRSPQNQQWFFLWATRGFAEDDRGGVWAGSDGGGVAWFREDTITFFNTFDQAGFSSAGPRISGSGGLAPYVETRVTKDPDGDIFICHLYSDSNAPLIRVPAEWIARGNNPDVWNYFTSTTVLRPGSNHTKLNEVVVDPYGRVWLGATSVVSRLPGESYVFDDRNTPADTTDDVWFSYVPSSRQDNMTCFDPINNAVLDWEVDQEGYLWVGTYTGAYYTQGGVPRNLNQLRFICAVDLPVGTQVNDIHVDAQNNKWFATDKGVAVLDRNFTWIHAFQTSSSLDYPSDLVSNNVLAITSNPRTGEVWIGTADGLSKLDSPYLKRSGDLEGFSAYPNPFRADGSQRMYVKYDEIGGRFDELRVYTSSGGLVRKLSWAQMNPLNQGSGWDGRNEDGQLVAGGIYLLLASSDDGRSATGKIAVLGR